MSWNFQNASLPAEAEHGLGRVAAGFAFGWKGSGLFFQTMRSLSGPYVSLSWLIVGSTREQNGHWKSLKSTIVTGAERMPHIGSLDEIGTAASSSLHTAASAASAATSSVAALAIAPLRSTPYISIPPARKQSRKPTMAVPLFMNSSSWVRPACAVETSTAPARRV